MIEKKMYGNIFSKRKFLITFDSEAFKEIIDNDEIQSLAIGCIYYRNNNLEFAKSYNNLENFNKHILKLLLEHNSLLIAAHNIDYDFQLLGLIDYFNSHSEYLNLKKDVCFIGDVTYLKFSNEEEKLSIEFIDSFNFFKQSLKEIGEKMFNEKKYFSEEEYNEKDINVWNEHIKNNGYELAKNDSKLLYKLMLYLKSYKLPYGVSAPSTSFKDWNMNYNKNLIIDMERFDLIANEIYHGGRTEVYKRFTEIDAVSLDINSLYPYVMKKYKYSIKFHKEIKNPEIKTIINNIKKQDYNYVLLIKYKTNMIRNPIMSKLKEGFIDLKENTLWVTGNELLSLYNHCNPEIIIYRCLEFYNDDLFSEYIDKWYNVKKNSKNEIEKSLAKLMLNSLYGKMGQRDIITVIKKYEEVPEIEPFKDIKTNIELNDKRYSLFNSYIQYNEKGNYLFAPIIASEITANARVENYEWQIKLGLKNIIQTDTDSFFIEKSYFNSLTDFKEKYINNELGNLKIEYDKSGIIKCNAPKDYTINGVEKIKGIRKNSQKVKNGEYITKQFKIKNNTENKVIVKTVKKQLTYDRVKLNYDKNGNSVNFDNLSEFLKTNNLVIR